MTSSSRVWPTRKCAIDSARCSTARRAGDYPAGRLRVIAAEFGTTVQSLRGHVRYWETAFDVGRRLETQSWVDTYDDYTYREIIPALPIEQGRTLRAAFRKKISNIELLIEALGGKPRAEAER